MRTKLAHAVVTQQHGFDPIPDAPIPLTSVANQQIFPFLCVQDCSHDSFESRRS